MTDSQEIRKKHPTLGWHTIEDYVRWTGVEVGDMVCIDVGLGYGFPIGYLKSFGKYSITLTRYRPESRRHPKSLPWNEEDKPITYEINGDCRFFGISKLEQEQRKVKADMFI